jgi:hypothetical protein
MKNRIILLALIMTTLPAKATDPEKRLFERSGQSGGFGGVTLSVHRGDHLVAGGEGAALIGNFYIGGFGYGAGLGIYASDNGEKEFEIYSSAGGIMAGYLSNPSGRISLSFETRIGFGEATARASLGNNIYEEHESSLILINPNIGVVIKPVEFLRIKFFGGYNYTGDVNLIDISDNVFNGVIFGGSIHFGKF